jgi:hypothetical protein
MERIDPCRPLRITRCWGICRPPPCCLATAPSTGCACPGSTHRPVSPRCSTMKRRGCGDWLPAAGGPAARRRDRGDSSLPGDEGSFLACSFWLADAISGIGLVEEATSLYQRLLGLRNDVGLLSEEYDTVTGRHVGNPPGVQHGRADQHRPTARRCPHRDLGKETRTVLGGSVNGARRMTGCARRIADQAATPRRPR